MIHESNSVCVINNAMIYGNKERRGYDGVIGRPVPLSKEGEGEKNTGRRRCENKKLYTAEPI